MPRQTGRARSKLFFYFFNDLRRISGSHAVGRNVLCDHRAGADDDIIAYGYTGENASISADPNIFSNGDGCTPTVSV